MKSQTRHALKQDALAKAAASSASWMNEHRTGLVRWSIILGVAVLIAAGAFTYWTLQTNAANAALNEALDTYTTPVQQTGEPPMPGVFATSAERSKKAHEQFAAVVSKYGWMPEGAKAKYFVAVTDEEMGQTAAAEAEFKDLKGSSNHELANLAKLALANLYHSTKRDSDALSLLGEIVNKPSVTVTAYTAQLEQADIYDAEGQKDQAKAIWTKIKEADKDGAAGAIAAQKLGK